MEASEGSQREGSFGVNGDLTRATGQNGERVTEADILAEIDALASAPVPGGTPRSPLDDEPR